MHGQRKSTAVRLLGFDPGDGAHVAALLAQAPRSGPAYTCLHDDSLQEPDLYVANGSSPTALAHLDGMRRTAPALLLGGSDSDGYTHVVPPLEPSVLHDAMGRLVAERRRALALLGARGEPLLAERRRSPRVGKPDAADNSSRRQPPRSGKVLIVDKGGAFRDHLAGLVGEGRLPIAWTDSAPMAVRLCDETPVSLAMINTATPGIDPYALSFAIKSQAGAGRTAVVLLVGKGFPYDSGRARDSGVRGLLDKPVADRSLVAMLQRLT
jgi:CheY-like chemotaxis protein